MRCMVHSCPTKWAQWLPLAEFWYNTTFHSAHGHSPFEALYGHPPKHFGIAINDACATPDLDEWMKTRQELMQHIQHNLARAQQRMKLQADKNRQERSFAVGDWVYVKLQPHIQQSVVRRPNHKLSYKYFGPYLVLHKIGKVAYKLQLPVNSQIHPVLHVSQLKKAIPPGTTVSADDDLHLLCILDELPPDKVLAHRVTILGNRAVSSVLIQPHLCPEHWAFWTPSTLLPSALSASASASRGRAAA